MANLSMWSEFGFSDNPYDVRPLEPTEDGAALFTPRPHESAEFLSQMACKDGCVVVVSGDAGIGKTSFVNVQQYLMANRRAAFAPHLLPCLNRTPLQRADHAVNLGRRIVANAVADVEAHCAAARLPVPTETARARDWLSHKGFTNGYSISVGILSFGRSQSVPPPGEAILETWCSVLEAIASECRTELAFDGLVVCLENAESLSLAGLAELMMTYRDTLFDAKGVWWIVLGQSKLYARLESEDRRVSQRIRGAGIELPPLNAAEFHDLIERRVRFFGNEGTAAVSPLSEEVHASLFEAARGEVRFALDTADMLMTKIIKDVTLAAHREIGHTRAKPEYLAVKLRNILRKLLINNRIPDDVALTVLEQMAVENLKGAMFDIETLDRLAQLGSDTVGASSFAEYGFASASEFTDRFLLPLWSNGRLSREGLRDRERYALKGFAKLCCDFGKLSEVRAAMSA